MLSPGALARLAATRKDNYCSEYRDINSLTLTWLFGVWSALMALEA